MPRGAPTQQITRVVDVACETNFDSAEVGALHFSGKNCIHVFRYNLEGLYEFAYCGSTLTNETKWNVSHKLNISNGFYEFKRHIFCLYKWNRLINKSMIDRIGITLKCKCCQQIVCMHSSVYINSQQQKWNQCVMIELAFIPGGIRIVDHCSSQCYVLLKYIYCRPLHPFSKDQPRIVQIML